jgi:hypothetical protein
MADDAPETTATTAKATTVEALTDKAEAAAETISTKTGSLFEQARQAIEDAVETTVGAVKEHPIAAAGIAVGAAAAAAGAAFGVSKLLEKEPTEESKS